jgi:hypothetical protein
MILAVAIVYALSFVPVGPVHRVTTPPEHVRICKMDSFTGTCTIIGTARGPVRKDRVVRSIKAREGK